MKHIAKGGHVHAWNAEFEIPWWQTQMVDKLDWEPIPFLQWRDTAAVALALGFPAALEKSAPALGIEDRKDKRGKHLINKLCKPRKPSKNNPATRWTPETATVDFLDFYDYNIQDVVTERAMYWALPSQRSLHGELQVWRQTVAMNSRGLPMDIPSVERLINILEVNKINANLEVFRITKGKIQTVGQREKIIDWCKKKGTKIPNLQKKTVEDLLLSTRMKGSARVKMNPRVKKLLKLRQELSKSSTAKFTSVMNRVCQDGTVKDNLLYHGASTGRYAGRGFQAQNLPRASVSNSQAGVLRAIEVLDVDKPAGAIELMYGSVPHFASAMIRSMIRAPKGKVFYGADFLSVENKVTVWYADDEYGISIFNDGLDQYRMWCQDHFDIEYDDVTKAQRAMGKQVILGCCFGMGWKTLIKTCAKYGIIVSPKQAKRSVKKYRAMYPEVMEFHKDLAEAAMNAIGNPGRSFSCSYLKCRVEGEFLYIKLGSGRMLAYHKPEVRREKAPWGQYIPTVTHMGTNTYTKKWMRLSASPGRLTENVVQATARDIMVDRSFAIEEAGYPLILSVHDELIAQTPEDFGSTREFVSIMDDQPDWISGIPITTEGWKGQRYRK